MQRCEDCVHYGVCYQQEVTNDINEWLDEFGCDNYKPTADVAEVKYGEWIHTDKAKHWTGKDECSECTYHTWDRDDLSHLNYCPNCGAKMNGGKK